MSEPLLSAKNLTKRFGGLAAVNDVSVDLHRDRIHAVIGPNGAGKSTLTNLLSGDLPPTSGRITLNGVETAGKSPEKISRLGLGRSYQKTNIFLPFTVWDNVRLAAQSRERHAPWNPLRWLQSASSMKTVNQRCERAIELAGLTHRTQTVAATVSHGEQRQLEIAMTLATEPPSTSRAISASNQNSRDSRVFRKITAPMVWSFAGGAGVRPSEEDEVVRSNCLTLAQASQLCGNGYWHRIRAIGSAHTPGHRSAADRASR